MIRGALVALEFMRSRFVPFPVRHSEPPRGAATALRFREALRLHPDELNPATNER
jgi:hypothetical protein